MKGGHEMDCNRSNELMSLAIDQMIQTEDLVELEKHLLTCETCKEEFELLQNIQKSLVIIGTEEAELPSGFHAELMQSINDLEVQAHEEMVTMEKVIPLWRRIDRRYMNVAAVMVMVVVFALIGVNNLDNIRQSNDSVVMEKATSTESAKEESVDSPAPMMEAAVEEEVAMDMEKSEDKEMAAEAPEAALMMEVDETTTEVTVTEEITSVMEVTEEVASEPVLESIPSEENDATAVTYQGEAADSEATGAESNKQLARESMEAEKTPRSVENTIDVALEVNIPDNNKAVPDGLGLIIFGGFLGMMVISILYVLRKLK